LDNLTFDKALAMPGYRFLVKFDKSFAYGEKEDEFKTLCKFGHLLPSFFIAEVPVQEHGDKQNNDLRERFQLEFSDFPAYYLFSEALKDGLRYTGEVKAEDIADWLRRSSIKFPAIGTIAALDDLAKQWLKSGRSDELFEKAKTLAEQEHTADPKAKVYIKTMDKIKAKGVEHVEAEIARVNRLAETASEHKKAQFKDKIQILNVFAAVRDEL